MKNFCYLFVACLSLFAGAAFAGPGDTTVVMANNVNLANYGSYDSVVNFPAPGTSYRRIYMVFTLGKYMCGGSGYCGDWDYTVQNYLMTPAGDTFELGRLITPYANAGAPRTPWTWTQHYTYDVTDYASKLHDSGKIRIFYSGYSGGFTANIKFYFIEGTPDRNVLDIKRLWNGSFAYGDTTGGGIHNINTHFGALSLTAPTGTQTTDLKFTVTGHGSDPNYCSEFCRHNYQVMLNGTSVANQAIWRTDCGGNELYPQSGTWLYQRANWCPGSSVQEHHNILPGITGGTSYSASILFDDYASTGAASYTTEATVIYYGAVNKTLDASVEDIIAPTADENHYRENPICGKPMIHVKNTGSTAISSLSIQYGVQGSPLSTFTWSGTLASLGETDIELPALFPLDALSGIAGSNTFIAQVLQVNGTTDADTTNNKLTSKFVGTTLWPNSFKILMTTNNEPVSSTSSVSETSWVIYDMNNNPVAQRTNANISTSYTDTVTLPSGCYRFVMYDSGCNGLHWWANPTGVTAGSLYVKKLAGTNLAMHGYTYGNSGTTYSNDFGCGFSQYFYAADGPAGVEELSGNAPGMVLYPNPAGTWVNVDLAGIQSVNGTINIIDGLGRTVATENCTMEHIQLNTTQLSNGIYTVQFVNRAGTNMLHARVVIAK